jgi:hypothetical protein
LVARRITVASPIVFAEVESFRNTVDDGGLDAFYSVGAVEYFASNGVIMFADATLERPIDLRGEVPLTAGRWAIWACMRVLHPRFRGTRASVWFDVDGVRVGEADGVARRGEIPFWEHDVHFDWIHVGDFDARGTSPTPMTLTIEKRTSALGGLADLDLVAFVPLRP